KTLLLQDALEYLDVHAVVIDHEDAALLEVGGAAHGAGRTAGRRCQSCGGGGVGCKRWLLNFVGRCQFISRNVNMLMLALAGGGKAASSWAPHYGQHVCFFLRVRG